VIFGEKIHCGDLGQSFQLNAVPGPKMPLELLVFEAVNTTQKLVDVINDSLQLARIFRIEKVPNDREAF
jgi:hypothetical protein